jgi:hypothetical protein
VQSKKKSRLVPSPPATLLLRRKGTPSCFDFGMHQKLLYPEFFCHNCSEWDTCSSLRLFGKTRQKQKKGLNIMVCSASLPCTANHMSFTFPTPKENVASKV